MITYVLVFVSVLPLLMFFRALNKEKKKKAYVPFNSMTLNSMLQNKDNKKGSGRNVNLSLNLLGLVPQFLFLKSFLFYFGWLRIFFLGIIHFGFVLLYFKICITLRGLS